MSATTDAPIAAPTTARHVVVSEPVTPPRRVWVRDMTGTLGVSGAGVLYVVNRLGHFALSCSVRFPNGAVRAVPPTWIDELPDDDTAPMLLSRCIGPFRRVADRGHA